MRGVDRIMAQRETFATERAGSLTVAILVHREWCTIQGVWIGPRIGARDARMLTSTKYTYPYVYFSVGERPDEGGREL